MLTQTRLRSALLGSGAAVALLMPSAAAAADDIDGLKDQIQTLQDRLDQIEQDQAAIDERTQGLAPAALLVTGGDIEGSFKLPGSDTSMKIGGLIKADFFYDFDTNVDALGPSFYFASIPLDGTTQSNRDGEFAFHARQSFLQIETSTPSEFGEITTVFAFDFLTGTGDENTLNAFQPRVLYAYGSIGPVLAGHDWSTFTDWSSYPTTVDFFGPVGEPSVYQALIRYTQDLGDGLVVKLALENPETVGIATPLVPGTTTTVGTGSYVSISDPTGFVTSAATASGGPDSYPDAVIKFEYDQSWGHLGLAGIFRELSVDDGAGLQDSAFGWGFLAGLWAPTFGDDSLNAHFVFGEGIGRYVLGSFYDVEVAGFANGAFTDVDPIEVWAFHVGYNHWWTDSLASNVVYGYLHNNWDVTRLHGPNSTTQTGVATTFLNEDVQSVHANILWYPADPVTIGLEYIWGARHTISNAVASNSRVQMSFWYTF